MEEHEKLKESYCRLVEECIHLKEQRDEAVELLKELKSDSWGYPDDHEEWIDNYLEKIKA